MRTFALGGIGGVLAFVGEASATDTVKSEDMKQAFIEALVFNHGTENEVSLSDIMSNPRAFISRSEAWKHAGAALEGVVTSEEHSFLQLAAQGNSTVSSSEFDEDGDDDDSEAQDDQKDDPEAPELKNVKLSEADAEKVQLDTEKAEDAADTAVAAEASAKKKKKAKLNDKSVKKAIGVLNGMMENTQDEIDKTVIECVAFHRMNRLNYNSVVADLARLAGEIVGTEKGMSAAVTDIDDYQAHQLELDEQESQLTEAYNRQKKMDDAEMTVKKNDLAVAEFIMEITTCKRAKGGKKKAKKLLLQKSEEDGSVSFDDEAVQEKLDSMMNLESKKLLQRALDASFNGQIAYGSGLQDQREATGEDFTDSDSEEHEEDIPMAESTSFIQTEKESAECAMSLLQTQTEGKPQKRRLQYRCVRSRVNMCLINDNMSLMWGEFKDEVDELADIMKKRENAYEDEMKELKLARMADKQGEAAAKTNLDSETSKKNILDTESVAKRGEKKRSG